MNRPFERPFVEKAAGCEPAAKPRLGGAMKIFLLLAIGLGVGLRFLWLGRQEWWYDEVVSVLFSAGQKKAYVLPDNVPFAIKDFAPLLNVPAENGLTGILGTVENLIKSTTSEPHPPLFYLSEHVWMRLFGNSEAALRSLVVLLSCATIWVFYDIGRRLLGQRGALIFTALLALNPFFFVHSLNLRMYCILLLWAAVSGWCLLVLTGTAQLAGAESLDAESLDAEKFSAVQGSQRWLLRAGVAIAITAGLMSQYLFAYWLFALAALALYLDRKRWLEYGLTMAAGVLLFMPWLLWGTRQQLNNRRSVLLDQFTAAGGPIQSALQHGKDLTQTLANHLLLGHLTTGMSPIGEPIKPTAVAIGCAVVGFLALCCVGLYRRRQYRVLSVCALMGLLPLAVAMAVDILANKYTVGFGWGRPIIVALPGCVLLIAAWLELATGRWRTAMTATLLAAYLAVNMGYFMGRNGEAFQGNRQMFHQVNSVLTQSDQPTLVVMNSRAWGYVLRLVYYLDAQANAEVLATAPADVTAALKTALAKKPYERVLWLKTEYPLWQVPETPEEATALTAETESVLAAQYPLVDTQVLRGTMNLDRFELQVYQ
jgi:uncharacterized membrane protein